MILAVAGGKGGVGKSTVALNLGAELDAVVVDADLGMADLPERRGPDLHDVLAGRADPLEAVDETGAIDLLPCGRTLAGARAADPRELVDALTAVRRAYGQVVVDCPAGMAADAGLPLYAAEEALLVTTPAPTALSNAVRTAELARELDAGLRAVVLNRASVDAPTGRVRRLLGAPVETVPESETVAAAQRAGRPVAAVQSDAHAAHRFEDIAVRVGRRRSPGVPREH